jgi:hypothetical protein
MCRRFLLLALPLLLLFTTLAPAGGLREQVDLNVPEGSSLRVVIHALGQRAGLTFAFDEGVLTDLVVPEHFSDRPAAEALDLLLLEAGLFQSALPGGSIVIAPDSQSKRREYERQALQTFYLRHAEVKTVNAMLRGTVDIRKTAVDESSQTITIRDSADKVALAGALIERMDKPRAEVETTVELLLLPPGESLDSSRGVSDTGGLSEAAVRKLHRRRGVTLLARTVLGGKDGQPVEMSFSDAVPGPPKPERVGGNRPWQSLELQLELEARPSRGGRSVELRQVLQVEGTSRLGVRDQQGAIVPIGRSLDSMLRVQRGETRAITGLIRYAAAESSLEKPVARELVVLLTPRITLLPEISDADRAALDVGTERRTTRPTKRAGTGVQPDRPDRPRRPGR